MRRPGDNSPDPPGGRAAERLRDFLEKRMPVDQADAEVENLIDRSHSSEKDRDQDQSVTNSDREK